MPDLVAVRRLVSTQSMAANSLYQAFGHPALRVHVDQLELERGRAAIEDEDVQFERFSLYGIDRSPAQAAARAGPFIEDAIAPR